MRLFVALIPPPEVLAELAGATAGLPAGLPGVRWVPSRQWHLTLAFLGEVDDRTGAKLVERLGRVARRHPPPALFLAGAGRFGGRALWVGVAGECTALRRLATSVRAAARRCAIPTEGRSYQPHLTVARGGPHTDLAPLVERLRGFAGCVWDAGELHLVRSDLGAGPGGTARHEITSTWPLTGSPTRDRRVGQPGSHVRSVAPPSPAPHPRPDAGATATAGVRDTDVRARRRPGGIR